MPLLPFADAIFECHYYQKEQSNNQTKRTEEILSPIYYSDQAEPQWSKQNEALVETAEFLN